MTPFEKILLSIVAFFCTGSIGVLIYYLKDFSAKIGKLNDTLIITVERQGWQYKAIDDLDKRVKAIEKIKIMKGQEVLG